MNRGVTISDLVTTVEAANGGRMNPHELLAEIRSRNPRVSMFAFFSVFDTISEHYLELVNRDGHSLKRTDAIGHKEFIEECRDVARIEAARESIR